MALIGWEPLADELKSPRGAPLESAINAGVRGVLSDERLFGWGFSRREAGVDPAGSPASFYVEGVEGDGFVTLKGGQAQYGLSGAPLVSPRTMTVVGLVSATRGASSDLGGYATPLTALGRPDLLQAAPDVDISGELDAVMTGNRAAFLADRTPWLRVFPETDPDGLVDRPWATFRKTPMSDPSDLLRADFGVVDYLFRDEELERQQREWCETEHPMGVLVVRGVGGAGKTRFGIQLCLRMRERGWLAGWLPADWDALVAARTARLLVVDYAEAVDSQWLRAAISALGASASVVAPVRLVLLTRTRVAGIADPLSALTENANARVLQILAEGAEAKGAARPLTVEQRTELFVAAVEAFSAAWQLPRVPAELDLSDDLYQWPVQILFEALDRVLSGDVTGEPAVRAPVDRVLEHEERYWAAQLPDVGPEVRRWVAAAATIAGADTRAEAHELLQLFSPLNRDDAEHVRNQLIDWWTQAVPGPGLLNPLQPDRLGEYLVARTLSAPGMRPGAPAILAKIFETLSDVQVSAALDLIARARATHPELNLVAQEALASQFTALASRAVAAATADRSGQPRRIVGEALLRMLSRPLLKHVIAGAQNKAGALREAAVACTRLGEFALDGRRVEDARALLKAALDLYSAQAAMAPASLEHRHNMALTEQRLADLDWDEGARAEAVNGYRDALRELQELVRLDPTNLVYRRDSLAAQGRLADLDRASRRLKEAAAGYRHVLRGLRDLIDRDPRNPFYRRDALLAEGRLAAVDDDAGREAESAAGYRQVLKGLQELAEMFPAIPAFRRDVLNAERWLADLDGRSRRTKEALAGYQRVLRAARELVELDPTDPACWRDVMYAERKLADIDLRATRTQAAVAGYRRVLQAANNRVELDPTNPSCWRDVMAAEERLANLSERSGRFEDAVAGQRRALQAAQELVRLEPSKPRYQKDVGAAERRLIGLMAQAHQREQAETWLRRLRAVEGLAEIEPSNAARQIDVVVAELRLASLQGDLGQRDEAIAGSRRAVRRAQGLVEFEPTNEAYRHELQNAERQLRRFVPSTPQRKDVAASYRRVLQAAKDRVELNRESPKNWRDVLDAEWQLLGLMERTGQIEEAISGRRRVLEVARKLVELVPSKISYRRQVLAAERWLAELAEHSGQLAEAAAGYRSFLQDARELTALEPALFNRYEVLFAQRRVADLDERAGRIEEAAAEYHKYLQEARQFVELDPANPFHALEVLFAQRRIADLYERAGRVEEAVAAYNSFVGGARELVDQLSAELELAHLDRDATRINDAAAEYRWVMKASAELAELLSAESTLAEVDSDVASSTKALAALRLVRQAAHNLMRLDPENETYSTDVAHIRARISDSAFLDSR